MSSAGMDSTTASPPPARPITFLDPPGNSPITPDRTASRPNPCFNCNQEGHWFRDCPLRRSPAIPAAVAAAGAPPPLKCHCGGACLVLTSKTEKNPGRQFYICPVLPKKKKCKLFKWCDEVIAGQINGAGSPGKWQQRNDVNSPRKQTESSSPMCSCGAGRARILTMEKGEYYGRQYYGCHIKKGQGACNFFQWRKEETPEGMGEVKVPLFILVPEEPITQMLANDVCETSRPERMTSDVSFVPESPLPSSRDHRPYHEPKHVGDQFSPIKKLSLDESSASSIAATPRICFKCGKEAYWMSKCGHCFKCDIAETMATGVGEKEVGSAQEWMVPDVSVVPESPLSSIDSHQGHQPEHAGDRFSPIKRLSLDGNFGAAAASRPRICIKCGSEGHWMSEYGHCLKCDEAEMVAAVVGEANLGTESERMASDVRFIPEHLQLSRDHRPMASDVRFIPEHLQLSRDNRPNGQQDDQPTFVVHGFSPSRRLSPDESSSVLVALSPAKCLKCGKDGHWMSECQPCLKCGKVGHRMRDCTACTVWW